MTPRSSVQSATDAGDASMNLAVAWRVFVDALTITPYARLHSERQDMGSVTWHRWLAQDTAADPAGYAFIGDCAPEVAMLALHSAGRAARGFAVLETQPDMANAYAEHGFRCTGDEWLMARSLAALPEVDSHVDVRGVQPDDDVAWLNAHDAEGAWIREENLAAGALHCYYVRLEDRVIARACAATTATPQTHYVRNVFTDPAHRRRGLSRAVMLRLLRDAVARGESWSVLGANADGKFVYDALDYATLARILLFEQGVA